MNANPNRFALRAPFSSTRSPPFAVLSNHQPTIHQEGTVRRLSLANPTTLSAKAPNSYRPPRGHRVYTYSPKRDKKGIDRMESCFIFRCWNASLAIAKLRKKRIDKTESASNSRTRTIARATVARHISAKFRSEKKLMMTADVESCCAIFFARVNGGKSCESTQKRLIP